MLKPIMMLFALAALLAWAVPSFAQTPPDPEAGDSVQTPAPAATLLKLIVESTVPMPKTLKVDRNVLVKYEDPGQTILVVRSRSVRAGKGVTCRDIRAAIICTSDRVEAQAAAAAKARAAVSIDESGQGKR